MTKKEYSDYLYRCYKFLKYNRYWHGFKFNDLCNNIFLEILQSGKHINNETFSEWLKPSYNKMVRDYYSSHPQLRLRMNNMRSKRYYDNREDEMRKAREYYYRKREDLLNNYQRGKAELSNKYIKMLLHSNRGKKISEITEAEIIKRRNEILRGERYNPKKGKEHYKFRGLILTPFGKFESTYQAAKIIGISAERIRQRINDKNNIDYYIIT